MAIRFQTRLHTRFIRKGRIILRSWFYSRSSCRFFWKEVIKFELYIKWFIHPLEKNFRSINFIRRGFRKSSNEWISEQDRSLNGRDRRLAGSLSKLIVTLSGRGRWICNRVQVWINFRRWRVVRGPSSKQEEEEAVVIGRPRTILINMRRPLKPGLVCPSDSILFICDSDRGIQNSNGDKTYRP